MRRAVACVVLLAGASCPSRSDVTPLIHVDPRAAARADWLAHAAEAGASYPKPARVHVMKEGEALGGPNAVGRPGLVNASTAISPRPFAACATPRR